MSWAALLLAARLNLIIDLALNEIMTIQPLLPTARAQPSRYQPLFCTFKKCKTILFRGVWSQ